MKITQEDVIRALNRVEHPAINHSLIRLGIVKDIKLTDNTVSLVFAFPFPNIPIANTLIRSIEEPVRQMALDFDYTITIMNDDERRLFLHLEKEAWKG